MELVIDVVALERQYPAVGFNPGRGPKLRSLCAHPHSGTPTYPDLEQRPLR